jgi:biotin-dependent carboxylase-like uncharacterized protein
MRLQIEQGGLLTTIQDLGRWGYLGRGMPVAGAMDPQALRLGNVLVGNNPNDAALEITLMGPRLVVADGEGLIALAGTDLGLTVNGHSAPAWEAHYLSAGDVIAFRGPKGRGCRSYLCLSGGIDVPPIMGSRSTYLRATLGGLDGRVLKAGDVLETGKTRLIRAGQGFFCPRELRPPREGDAPLRVLLGPQDKAFTASGIETFLRSDYVITSEADRMGYRLDGPLIEHAGEADIISDAIPPGSIQVPGEGKPICMLADGQTTGGYTKIAVLITTDRGALAQRMPGESVRFSAVTYDEAVHSARTEARAVEALLERRSAYRSRPRRSAPAQGNWQVVVDGVAYDVGWEEIRP